MPSISKFSESLSYVVRGKRVLLTGASSGVGLAMARQLAPTGAQLLLVARNEDNLKAAQQDVLRRGGKAEIFPCNLSKENEVEKLIESVGQVDILINNAGRSIRRRASESTERFHDFRRTMELNYFAPMRLMLAFLPGMKASGYGHVINILSMGCQVRTPRFSAYLASKLALDGASRCIAGEVIHRNIRMTQVYLPLVRTPMIAPTELYNNVTAMDVEAAAERSLRGLVSGAPRMMMPLGFIFEAIHLVAPTFAQKTLNNFEKKGPNAKMVGDSKSKPGLGSKIIDWLAYGSKQSRGV